MPIYKSGTFIRNQDGMPEHSGYVFSLAEDLSPIYLCDEIFIDSQGLLTGKRPDRFAPDY